MPAIFDWREPRFNGVDGYGLPPWSVREHLLGALGAFPNALRQELRLAFGARALRRAARELLEVRISLGSGATVCAGWLGLDLDRGSPDSRGGRVFPGDLRRRLPFGDGTVDDILLEHSLEHIALDDGLRLLAECRRVQRSSGILRVVVPDGDLVAKRLLARCGRADPVTDADFAMHRWPDRQMVQQSWRSANRFTHQWGAHRALLGGTYLISVLEQLGYRNVICMAPEGTAYLNELPDQHHLRFPGTQPDAVCVEAVR